MRLRDFICVFWRLTADFLPVSGFCVAEHYYRGYTAAITNRKDEIHEQFIFDFIYDCGGCSRNSDLNRV